MGARWALAGPALAAVLMAGQLSAQDLDKSEQFGDYRVYYNVVNSNFLAPEVADRYGIDRDDETAVLTVTVKAPDEQGQLQDQPAEVSGGVSDLVHYYGLDFQEHRDPQAIYYIAELPAQGITEFDIDLEIEPSGSDETFEMEVSERLEPRALPPQQ